MEWCAKNGIELEKVRWHDDSEADIREEDEYYCRTDMKHIILNRKWWRSRNGEKGKLNRYTKGGLIQYVAEFEGVGLDESLNRCLSSLYPDVKLPTGSSPAVTQKKRRSLSDRISSVRLSVKRGKL